MRRIGNGGFWKFQPRGPLGRWINMGGDSSLGKAGRKVKKGVRNTKEATSPEGLRRNAKRAKDSYVPGQPLGVVPYSRTSLRSQTVGINVGKGVTKHYKVSAGAYVRVERKTPSKIEEKYQSRLDQISEATIDRLANAITPYTGADRLVKKVLRKAQKKVYDGLAPSFGAGKYRAGVRTDWQGKPTFLIKHQRKSADAPFINMASASALRDYNAARRKAAGKKVSGNLTNARPQRRNARNQRRKKAA